MFVNDSWGKMLSIKMDACTFIIKKPIHVHIINLALNLNYGINTNQIIRESQHYTPFFTSLQNLAILACVFNIIL